MRENHDPAVKATKRAPSRPNAALAASRGDCSASGLHGATRLHLLGECADSAGGGLLPYLTAASRRCTKPSIAGASIQRTTATRSCSGST